MANTLTQTAEFAAALYSGLIIGILFDLFSLLHVPFKNKWVHALIDAAFYSVAGALAGMSLLFINGGTVRLWLLLVMAFGAFTYRFTAAENIIK